MRSDALGDKQREVPARVSSSQNSFDSADGLNMMARLPASALFKVASISTSRRAARQSLNSIVVSFLVGSVDWRKRIRAVESVLYL